MNRSRLEPSRPRIARRTMAGLLVAVTLLAAAPVVLAAPHTEVPVGVLLSDPDVTEPSAVFRGLELAAQQLTAAGLPVRLIAEDPAPNAAAAALRLIAEGVVAIVGAGTSGDTIRAAEAHAIPRSVVMISPAATAPRDHRSGGRPRAGPPVPHGGTGHAAGQGCRHAGGGAMGTPPAILHVDNQYGAGLAEHFRAAYEAAGGRVVAQVGHPEPTSGSYADELRAVLAGGPDVVAAYSYSRHAEVYVKEAAEMFGFRTFTVRRRDQVARSARRGGSRHRGGPGGDRTRPAVRPGECRVRPPVPGRVWRQAAAAVHRKRVRRAGGDRPGRIFARWRPASR